jgi:hypothetical protein
MVEPGAVAIRWPAEGPKPLTTNRNSGIYSDPAHPAVPAPPHATLIEWYVDTGERVEKDQELLLGARGASLHSLPSPVSGILLTQWSETGEEMGHGETLGWIRPDTVTNKPQ